MHQRHLAFWGATRCPAATRAPRPSAPAMRVSCPGIAVLVAGTCATQRASHDEWPIWARGRDCCMSAEGACDLAPRGGDHTCCGPLASIAACTPMLGHWHAANQRDGGRGPMAPADANMHALSQPMTASPAARVDLTSSGARICSGTWMAVGTVSVDSCTVDSASRPISAASTSSVWC